jgi:diaminopimelate epimerase
MSTKIFVGLPDCPAASLMPLQSGLVIPFIKAHGAGNDFLLTLTEHVDATADLSPIARAICERHTGIGADGWMLVDPTPAEDRDASIRLFNADGSEPELSGNGTRCAAALLAMNGRAAGEKVRIATGAGVKELRLIDHAARTWRFEMNMGLPHAAPEHVRYMLPLQTGAVEVTILDVGNPQCAVLVEAFPPEGWREMGAEIERHALFPNRTNVSFAHVLDEHTIEVLFYERGVGETLSSGTGSTGAAAAAFLRDLVTNPVRVVTGAGDLEFRWTDSAYLTGPAQIVGTGEFLLD